MRYCQQLQNPRAPSFNVVLGELSAVLNAHIFVPHAVKISSRHAEIHEHVDPKEPVQEIVANMSAREKRNTKRPGLQVKELKKSAQDLNSQGEVALRDATMYVNMNI